jgi:hypothetical protein
MLPGKRRWPNPEGRHFNALARRPPRFSTDVNAEMKEAEEPWRRSVGVERSRHNRLIRRQILSPETP